MTKFVVFLFIIFLAVLSYLAVLNNEPVTIKLSEQYSRDLPKIALILISSVIGALSILAIIAVRDARRYIEGWQNQRHQKKNLRMQEFYSKGMDAFYACRYKEATEFFNRILNEDAGNVNALLRSGDIAYNKGDLTKAKDFYIKAKEIKPQSIEMLFSLEKVFEAEHKWQEALRYLDNILEVDNENPKALYKKREIYERNKDWEAFLDTQYKLLKSDIPQKEKEKENKNLLGYKYELGYHYLEKGEMDRAKKILRTIIKLDKDFIAAYLTLADSYIKEGNFEKAEELLTKGYEATSSLIFLTRLEDFFISACEPGRIIELYQKAIQRNPKDQKLQFFLAKLYYRLEMTDYAYETITGIDTTIADYPDLHVLFGEIYERRMQHDKAAEEFKKALNSKKPLLVPFCCSNCSYTSKEWNGRCPKCKHWNTLTLNLSGTSKI